MPKALIPLRKELLQKQIFEARALGEKENILFLESQWVHRYGIETLEDSYINETRPATTIPLDRLENSNQTDECEITSQQNLFSNDVPLEDAVGVSNSKQTIFEEKIDESYAEKDLGIVSKQEFELSDTDSDKAPVMVSPPPIPALNHLRRWLPSIDDSIPKAS